MLATDRRQPATIVTCCDCGQGFELSARNAQRYRSEGRDPRCRECRRPPRPKPTERDRAWWTDRFTPEEIRDMVEALFDSAARGQ